MGLVGDADLLNDLQDNLQDALIQLSQSPQRCKDYNKMIWGRPIVCMEEIIALILQESGARNIDGAHGELWYFQVKEPLAEQEAKNKYSNDRQWHVESQLIMNKLQWYGIGIYWNNIFTVLWLQRWLDVKKSWLFAFERMKSNRIINLSSQEQDQLIYLSYNRWSLLKAIIWKCFNDNHLSKPVTYSQIIDMRYGSQEHDIPHTFKSPQFPDLMITSETDFTTGWEQNLMLNVKKPCSSQEQQSFYNIFALLYDKWLLGRNSVIWYHVSPNDKRIATKYMVQIKIIKKLLSP